MNQITIDFTPCDPSPINGYRVRFRPVGTMTYFIADPNATTSPFVFVDDQSGADDGVAYEGFIEGDCGGGNFGPPVAWSTGSVCCDPVITSAAAETVAGFDADAQAFIDAVGTLDSDTQNAINDLVVGLKDAGIWTKFYAIYPYAGSTAAEHKWNLKDPVDSDAAYRLTFVSMGHTAQGLVPTNSSADTKFMTFPSINSEHISAYILTNNTTVGCELGNTDSSANNGTGFYARATSNNTYWNTDTAAKVFNPTTDARGLWVVSRTGSTAAELNKNGATLQTSSASSAAGPGTTIKIATDAGGVNNTDKITAWNSIGSGLTTAECAALYTVVQAYQTALGRSV